MGREELILAIVSPFGIVGELAALDTAPRSASVITLETSELLRIPGPAFRDAVFARPELALAVLRHLGQTIRNINERLRTISMYDAEGQTVRALFLSCERAEDRPGQVVLTGCPRVLHIAQMLGCRRETVSTAISSLERAGYAKVTRAGNALEEIALSKKAVNKYLKGLHLPLS